MIDGREILYDDLLNMIGRLKDDFNSVPESNCLIFGTKNEGLALALTACFACGVNVFLIDASRLSYFKQSFLKSVAFDYEINSDDFDIDSGKPLKIRKVVDDEESLEEKLLNCIVLTTSGTQSMPKGVVLKHEGVLADAIGILKRGVFRESETYINIIPLTHSFGLMADLIIPLMLGNKVIYSRNIVDYFEKIARYSPEQLNVPPLVADLLSRRICTCGIRAVFDQRRPRILCAGASVGDHTVSVMSEHDIDVFIGYGLTECSPCVSLTSPGMIQRGTVGLPLDGIEVRTSDEGELLVKGSILFHGYLGDPDGLIVDEDGWLHTRDVATIDENGCLHIVGRLDNLVIFSDGTKCHPEIIEKHLMNCLDVDELLVSKDLHSDRWIVEYFAERAQGGCVEEGSFAAAISQVDSHPVSRIIKRSTPLRKNGGLGKVRRRK